jgi:hypothetical protein
MTWKDREKQELNGAITDCCVLIANAAATHHSLITSFLSALGSFEPLMFFSLLK